MKDADSRLFEAAQDDDAGEVERLVAAGADIAAKFDRLGLRHGASPLIVAAGKGSWRAARALLELGADPDAKDTSGRTALFCSAERVSASVGYVETMKLLLEAGADPEGSGAKGMLRPLDVCAMEGSLRKCELLLGYGAKVDAPGKSALALAVKHRQGHLARLLLDSGGDPKALLEGGSLMHAACMEGNAELAKALADCGAVFEQEDFDAAVSSGSVRMLDMALELDPGLESKIKGRSAILLERALENGNSKAVKWLMDKGADPNAQTSWGPAACLAYANEAGFGCFDPGSLDLAALRVWAEGKASSEWAVDAQAGKGLLEWAAKEEARRIGECAGKACAQGAKPRI